jgi:hypothetical protein
MEALNTIRNLGNFDAKTTNFRFWNKLPEKRRGKTLNNTESIRLPYLQIQPWFDDLRKFDYL